MAIPGVDLGDVENHGGAPEIGKRKKLLRNKPQNPPATARQEMDNRKA